MCLQEAPKHILFSLLTPCTTYFPRSLTLKISPLTGLTSFLSKVVRQFVSVFMVKISLNFNKNLFHDLLNNSINNRRPIPPPPQKKKPKAVKDRGGGSRVGMTAVKDSMVFFKASLSRPGRRKELLYKNLYDCLINSLIH